MIYFNEWLEKQKKIEAFKKECLKCNEPYVENHYWYILEDGTVLHTGRDKISQIAKKYFGPDTSIDKIIKNGTINWIEVYDKNDINWVKLPSKEPNDLQYWKLKDYFSLTFVKHDSLIIFTNGYEHHSIEENKIHTDGDIVETIIWFIKYFYQFGLLFTSMDEANTYLKPPEEEK